MAAPSKPIVKLQFDDHVATITMADPARRNTLGTDMLTGLQEALQVTEAHQARAVILRAGPAQAVWCAGFDVNALLPGIDSLAPDGALQSLFRAVETCPAPVIAMLHGTAWGAGVDLALRCDIAIADPSCTLAFTPARLGLPYDLSGLLNVMLRGGLPLAMEMFTTAEPVRAERALAAGLVNRVVPEAELEAVTLSMAREIAANAPLSVASAKRQLRALHAALAIPDGQLGALLAERQAALESKDFAEGLSAFREKRRPTFEGR